MSIQHHTFVNDTQYEWAVDLDAAARAAAWVARAPEALQTDLEGMSRFFPHWVLAGCAEGRPSRCSRCATPLVPTHGAMRCMQCERIGRAGGLMWLGHIPALARPEPSFLHRQKALREAGFLKVTVRQASYLLVPLTVFYPTEWPNVEPVVRYARRWLDALGLPGSSGTHHLIQNGRACIFAWRQWTAMPIHAVLQQRMVNHIASLLKIAAGQRPSQAFLGRVGRGRWEAEA